MEREKEREREREGEKEREREREGEKERERKKKGRESECERLTPSTPTPNETAFPEWMGALSDVRGICRLCDFSSCVCHRAALANSRSTKNILTDQKH